jgi:hypothetical protein
VLATLPWSAHVPNTEWLPVMVFATVFTTILLFAVGFPLVRRRMHAPAAATAPIDGVPAGPAGYPVTVPDRSAAGAPAPRAPDRADPVEGAVLGDGAP